MMKKSNQTVRCISCELSCQLYPDNTVRSHYCSNATFSIWPEGNNFLKSGVIGKLLLENQNHLSSGFVFVDFSFPNLRYFADQEWVDHLAETGMHIVIIADKSLMPLANYWLTKSNKIQGIIYADDDEFIQQQKIRRLFTGRLANTKRGRTLNFAEFTLLKRFMSGASIQQIIRIDNIDVKKVYVHKLRLEQKLGHSIHKIISHVL
ncbi:helix-turn-helix transcriptional regulator [Trabulsiella odontotermitis]|uniref:RmbA family protein n=1 Tax=Trabulsiella guamensis ATCC 49490 TaxID=1005994 RepID=A0A084ZQ76_9ENTR|nr:MULTISPECIES: helix-turn-helix transcriptional regulator [Trabulsiella]KFB99620.1 RmbA family protein [Trabulsiella guamensis ATCC 49490]WHP31315.1 helix-turn-helix transcriptional regulator [Trabulsiella odontotermitis]